MRHMCLGWETQQSHGEQYISTCRDATLDEPGDSRRLKPSPFLNAASTMGLSIKHRQVPTQADAPQLGHTPASGALLTVCIATVASSGEPASAANRASSSAAAMVRPALSANVTAAPAPPSHTACHDQSKCSMLCRRCYKYHYYYHYYVVYCNNKKCRCE